MMDDNVDDEFSIWVELSGTSDPDVAVILGLFSKSSGPKMDVVHHKGFRLCFTGVFQIYANLSVRKESCFSGSVELRT